MCHKGYIYLNDIATNYFRYGLIIYNIENDKMLPMSALSYLNSLYSIVYSMLSHVYQEYYTLQEVGICGIDSEGSVLVCEPKGGRLVLISARGFIQAEYKFQGIVNPRNCAISDSHIFILYSQNSLNYLAKIPRF